MLGQATPGDTAGRHPEVSLTQSSNTTHMYGGCLNGCKVNRETPNIRKMAVSQVSAEMGKLGETKK